MSAALLIVALALARGTSETSAQVGVVTPSAMPGAIVEPLFLSNDGDAAVQACAEGEHAIVTAYEHAIVEYFEQFAPQPR